MVKISLEAKALPELHPVGRESAAEGLPKTGVVVAEAVDTALIICIDTVLKIIAKIDIIFFIFTYQLLFTVSD